jgi:uncharacterized protein with beta-barrel porin domain
MDIHRRVQSRRFLKLLCLLVIGKAISIPVQGATPAATLASQRQALWQKLAKTDLLFQSGMNQVSLLQMRQISPLLYNHFELSRTEREYSMGARTPDDGGKISKQGGGDKSDGKHLPWDLWTQESGSLLQSSSTTTSPGKNSTIGAFLLGLDYEICRDVRAGLFSGYMPGSTTFSGVQNGTSITQGLVYGGSLSYAKPNGGFYADGVMTGGGFQASTSQSISLNGKNYGTVSAAPVSSTLTLGGDTGYDVRRGPWTYGPIGTIQYTQLHANAVNLSGPGSASAIMNAQYLESLYTGLGSHVLYAIPCSRSIKLVPELRLLWSHEFLNGSTTPTGSLSQNPGHTYSATTAAAQQNVSNAYAGFTLLAGKSFSSSLFYGAALSSGASIQTLILSINLAF